MHFKKLMTIAGCGLLIASVASCAGKSNEGADESATPEGTTQATTQAAPQQSQQAAAPAQGVPAGEGIIQTPTGLGYRVIKEGEGEHPSPTSTATVRYTGKHLDGTVFDSSEGQTVDFPLYGVIPGFSEGLQLMNRGAVYELFIPGELGYGPQGIPGVIGPNETLVFELELVDFQ